MKSDYIADIEYFKLSETEEPKIKRSVVSPSLLESLNIHINVDKYPQTKVREVYIKDVSIEPESE